MGKNKEEKEAPTIFTFRQEKEEGEQRADEKVAEAKQSGKRQGLVPKGVNSLLERCGSTAGGRGWGIDFFRIGSNSISSSSSSGLAAAADGGSGSGGLGF